MRIMFSYGSINNGGAEKVITAIANYMVKRGDDVFIVVADEGTCGYILDDKVNVISLNTIGVSRNVTQAFKRSIMNICSLRKQIKKICPDIIVAMDPRYAVEAKFASPSRKVVGSERSNPYAARSGKIERFFVWLSSILDGFIFQTNGAKAYYPGAIQNKSIVISNGLFEEINVGITPIAKREPFKICATGRLSYVKRYDTMIEAVKLAHEKKVDVELHIYGDGEEKENIKKLIADNKMQKQIILEGRTKTVYDELIKYRYFLLTSENEGMPNGLIDAMACGCICISTDCDFGPSELIDNGRNGFLVPVGASKEIAEIILNLISNEELGEKISNNALNIRERLSKEKILKNYYEYIKEIAYGVSNYC